jgi:hypothetical protein
VSVAKHAMERAYGGRGGKALRFLGASDDGHRGLYGSNPVIVTR